MNKANIAKACKSLQTAIAKHSPEILMGFGIAGMTFTTVLAVKATPKALKLIEAEKKASHKDKLKPIEVVKVAWKPYIPAAITGVTSIGCLIGATSVNARRNAALATAYKLSETAFTEYKEKVVETLGEKKEQVIHDKVAKSQVEKSPASANEIIVTGYGDSRFFDPMSGRHFYSSIDKVRKAENEVNANMINDVFGYASLNDFYDELNLERTEIGDIVGWTVSRRIKMGISSQVDDDGKASIVLVYHTRPEYGFDKL